MVFVCVKTLNVQIALFPDLYFRFPFFGIYFPVCVRGRLRFVRTV